MRYYIQALIKGEWTHVGNASTREQAGRFVAYALEDFPDAEAIRVKERKEDLA
jgi:hypothetical protein